MVTYKSGDLLESGCNVICHQVNCQGVMGSGIAKLIRDKYPRVFEQYINKHKTSGSHLGDIDIILIDPKEKRYIVNMYSQDNYLPRSVRHTDYTAFLACIIKLKSEITGYTKYCLPQVKFKIGFPYGIGCGLGGGDWNNIKAIIEKEFADKQWEVEIWKL